MVCVCTVSCVPKFLGFEEAIELQRQSTDVLWLLICIFSLLGETLMETGILGEAFIEAFVEIVSYLRVNL